MPKKIEIHQQQKNARERRKMHRHNHKIYEVHRKYECRSATIIFGSVVVLRLLVIIIIIICSSLVHIIIIMIFFLFCVEIFNLRYIRLMDIILRFDYY